MPSRPLRCLITGATSGIGRIMADILATKGHSLILVARSLNDLEGAAAELREKYGIDAMGIPCDLSTPGSADALFRTLQERHLSIDILINNAGFATFGPFGESDPDTQRSMLELNITSLTLLTRLLLPDMTRRTCGWILNIASTAAFQPGPLMSVYYATKAYVLSFSEAIRNELTDAGVSVTCLCPGPTKTQFQARAGMQDSPLFGRAMDVRTVAQAGIDGLFAGKDIVIPGFYNKFLAFATRFASRSFAASMARRVQETTRPR